MDSLGHWKFDVVARLALAGLLALMVGCPRTDQAQYEELEVGEATFRNSTSQSTLWLGGCNAFEQQRLLNGEWISQGGDIPCLWEGLASPLAPGDVRVDSFTARSAGTWRLSYPVGFGCRPDQPLHPVHCSHVTQLTTNTFDVGTPDPDEAFCFDSGGFWDLASCGDYTCGTRQFCAAVIPGCDCGPNANFVSGVGCVDDPSCDEVEPDPQALCEDTGGFWDPLSCGDYSCGNRPVCRAIIPGCNCGPTGVFDEVVGCVDVPCGAPQG